MDGVVHSCVQLNVLLDASLFGDVRRLWAASSIKASFTAALECIVNDLNEGHDARDDHGSDNGVTDQLEPRSVEVAQTTANQAKRNGALGHVRVDKEEQDRCVDELHPENDFGSAEKAASLTAKVELVDGAKHPFTQDYVENDDDDFETLNDELLAPL